MSEQVEIETSCGFSTSAEALKIALSASDSTEKFSDVLNTLMDSVDRHVREVRTQLVLCVLLHEGKQPRRFSHLVLVFFAVKYTV